VAERRNEQSRSINPMHNNTTVILRAANLACRQAGNLSVHTPVFIHGDSSLRSASFRMTTCLPDRQVGVKEIVLPTHNLNAGFKNFFIPCCFLSLELGAWNLGLGAL